MRKIKPSEIAKGGKRYCTRCKREGKRVEAVWTHMGEHACEDHKGQLDTDDGHMSEADHQTWGRL